MTEYESLVSDVQYFARRLELVNRISGLPPTVRFDLARLPLSNDEIEVVMQAFGEEPPKGWGISDVLDEYLSRRYREVPQRDLKHLQQRLVLAGYMPPATEITGEWSPEWSGAFRRYEADLRDRIRSGEHLGSASVKEAVTSMLEWMAPTVLWKGLVGWAKGFVQQTPETVERLGLVGGAASGAALGGMIAGPIGAVAGGVIGGLAGFFTDLFVHSEGEDEQSAIGRIVDALSPVEEWGGNLQAFLEDLGWVVSAASMISGAKLIAAVPTRFGQAMAAAQAVPAKIGETQIAGRGIIAKLLGPAGQALPSEPGFVASRVVNNLLGLYDQSLAQRWMNWVRINGLIARSQRPIWQAGRQVYTGLFQGVAASRLASIVPPEKTTIERAMDEADDPVGGIWFLADLALAPLYPETLLPKLAAPLSAKAGELLGDITAEPFVNVIQRFHGVGREQALAMATDMLGGPGIADVAAASVRLSVAIRNRVYREMYELGIADAHSIEAVSFFETRMSEYAEKLKGNLNEARKLAAELVQDTLGVDGARLLEGYLTDWEQSERGLSKFKDWLQAEELRTQALDDLAAGRIAMEGVAQPKFWHPITREPMYKAKGGKVTSEVIVKRAQVEKLKKNLERYERRAKTIVDPVARATFMRAIENTKNEIEAIEADIARIMQGPKPQYKQKTLLLIRKGHGFTNKDVIAVRKEFDVLWNKVRAAGDNDALIALHMRQLADWAGRWERAGLLPQKYSRVLQSGRIPSANFVKGLRRFLTQRAKIAAAEVFIPGYSQELAQLGYKFALGSGEFLWLGDVMKLGRMAGLGDYSAAAYWLAWADPRVVKDESLWHLRYRSMLSEVAEVVEKNGILASPERLMDDLFDRLRRMNHPAVYQKSPAPGEALREPIGPLISREKRRLGTYIVDIRELSPDDIALALKGTPKEGGGTIGLDDAVEIKRALMRGSALGAELTFNDLLKSPSQVLRDLGRNLRVSGLPGFSDFIRSWRVMRVDPEPKFDLFKELPVNATVVNEALAASEARRNALVKLGETLRKTQAYSHRGMAELFLDSLSEALYRKGVFPDPDGLYKILDIDFASGQPEEGYRWLGKFMKGQRLMTSRSYKDLERFVILEAEKLAGTLKEAVEKGEDITETLLKARGPLTWFYRSAYVVRGLFGLRPIELGDVDRLYHSYVDDWKSIYAEIASRYGGGEQPLVEVTDDIISKMQELTLKSGGFTWNPRTGEFEWQEGKYVVSITPGTQAMLWVGDYDKELFAKAIRDFMDDERLKDLLTMEGTYIGGWVDDFGRVHLDPTEIVDSEAFAIAQGEKNRQQTIFAFEKPGGRIIEIDKTKWAPPRVPAYVRPERIKVPLSDLVLDLLAVTAMSDSVIANTARALSVLDAYLNGTEIPRKLYNIRIPPEILKLEKLTPEHIAAAKEAARVVQFPMSNAYDFVLQVLSGDVPAKWGDRFFEPRNKIYMFSEALRKALARRREGNAPYDRRVWYFLNHAGEPNGEASKLFFEEHGWPLEGEYRHHKARLMKMRQYIHETTFEPLAKAANAVLEQAGVSHLYRVTPDDVMAVAWTYADRALEAEVNRLLELKADPKVINEFKRSIVNLRAGGNLDYGDIIIGSLFGTIDNKWARDIRRTLNDLGFTKDSVQPILTKVLGQFVYGELRGAFAMTPAGQALLRFWHTANPETLVHEIGHVLREFLSPDDIAALEKVYGRPYALWTEREEEMFAEDVAAFFKQRGLGREEARPIIERLHEMLGQLWRRMRGAMTLDGSGTVSPSVAAILDDYFGDAFRAVGVPKRVGRPTSVKPVVAGAILGAATGATYGDEKFKDAVRGALWGAVGGFGLRALARRNYGYLPDALVRLNMHLRYTLSPAFDAGRYMEQNMIAAMKFDLPILFSPERYMKARAGEFTSIMVGGRNLTSDNIMQEVYDYWDYLHGVKGYFKAIDDIDRRLYQAGILGFQPRKWEAVQAYLLKQRGWDDDKVREAVMQIGRYGIGRSRLERSLNFVFFPFSFNKKLLTTLHDWLTAAPLRALLLHEGMRRYYEANLDEEIGGFLAEHVPLLRQIAYINNLGMGIGPGRFFLEGLTDNRTAVGKAMFLLSSILVPSGAATPIAQASGAAGDLAIQGFVPVVLTGESISRAGGVEGLKDIVDRYIPFVRDLNRFFEDAMDQIIAMPFMQGASRETQLQNYLDELQTFKESVRPLAFSLGYSSVEGFLNGSSPASIMYRKMYEDLKIQLGERYPSAVVELSKFEVPEPMRERALMDLLRKDQRVGLDKSEQHILQLFEAEQAYQAMREMGILDDELVRILQNVTVREQALRWANDDRFAELYDYLFADRYGPIRRLVA